MQAEGPIRVLVVDDSAYVRKVVRQMLMRSPFIEVVGTTHNGREALDLVRELEPDVVTLDLIMPEMDGVAFLREQMARHPIPVVVMSIAAENSEMALDALDAGAICFVEKPTALATERLFEVADELIQAVKTAAGAKRPAVGARTLPPPTELPIARVPGQGLVDVVVIGISTGGPQGLRYLVPQLAADLPVPIAAVMHMPVGYTELYAQRLDQVSPLRVVEAREGDIVRPGTFLLAPAGRHMTLVRRADEIVVAHLDARPFDKPHRPSVDVLFESAARAFGSRTLGVVMTGMGSDGLQGAAWIKAQGGIVMTEALETCVVYGMPRTVDEAGLSDKSVPLDKMAQAIMEVV